MVEEDEWRGEKEEAKHCLRRVRLRREALGPSLSTFRLFLSPTPPSLCSPPVHRRYPCLLPASSVLSRHPVSFRPTRLGFYPLATCLSTRSLLKRRALGIRPPVWNALALMARALGPSEKRNIVLAKQPLLSRNSACTSSIFSPFSRPALYSLNDPLALVTLCLIIIARLSTLFYPILPLSRASTRPTTRRSIFLQRFLSPSPPPPTLSRDKIFILENGTNILKLSDYFPIVEAIRSFLIL